MSAVTDLSDALCLNLLSTHPNQLTPDAAHLDLPTQATPLDLVHAYSTGSFPATVPESIRNLISSIRTTQLPRTPISLSTADVPSISTQGMSPKKLHEVLRMASYIASLASQLSSSKPLHIVDIGAGQGYLTRTLKILLPSVHILALDADQAQSVGAQRWEARLLPHADPPIEHRVLFITPESLLQTVDDWSSSTANANENPVPVLFVALHACGSLTPAILRAFISASRHPNVHPNWYPASLVAVGCCYNLMDPSDYPKPTQHLPISAYHLAAQIPGTWLLQTDPPVLDPAVELAIRKVTWRAMLNTALEHATPKTPPAHDHPAPAPAPQNKSATVPARWNRRPPAPPPSSTPSENLDQENGIGITPNLLRLGKLKDSSYTTWNGFLDAAGERMGVLFREEDYENEDQNTGGDDEPEQRDFEGEPTRSPSRSSRRRRRGRDPSFENALGVLHVLRCFLGPVVESIILRDRIEWVREGLGLGPGFANDINTNPRQISESEPKHNGHDAHLDPGKPGNQRNLHVDLVNLFDQATGSGRNVAIVIAPESVDGVFLSPGIGDGV